MNSQTQAQYTDSHRYNKGNKMKKTLLILIPLLLYNCLFPFDNKDDTSSDSTLWYWFISSNPNRNQYGSSGSSSSTCITTSSSVPYGSCESAESLASDSCRSDSLTKGTVKFYKYKPSSPETVSFITGLSDKYYLKNCAAVYKENRTITTNSTLSDLETNQSLTSCQSQTSVSMSQSSFRCISVHSYCDSFFDLKLFSNPASATVSVSGTANSTFPSWTTASAVYSPLSTAYTAPVFGEDSYAAVPLGFNFTFFGETANSIYIYPTGKLSLSTASSSSSRIYPWYSDRLYADCESRIAYYTQNPDQQGSRIFTAEWKNVMYKSDRLEKTENPIRISFQVKLYETSNKIEFHYGDMTGQKTKSSDKAQLGISTSNSPSPGFMNGKSGSLTDKNEYSYTGFPVTGTVYRFTP